jgi:inosine-uridine nucleoside N-ribohydrolase
MTPLRRTLAVVLATLLVPVAAAAATPRRATPARPIPVILATDIGDDIDDSFALGFLLRSPELDLRLVLTEYGDTVYRARLAARLLKLAGRSHVPIAIGLRQAQQGGRLAEWLGDFSLADYPGRVSEDGVQALIEAVMRSRQTLTLVAIGPPPTLARALEREPRIAGRLRFAGMYGSLHEGYAEKSRPEPEWNVKADPAAARALLGAPWKDAIVTPLDTCARVRLDGDRYVRLRASLDPLARALVESYHAWCPKADWCDVSAVEKGTTTLYDTVAVYLAFSRDLVNVETTGVRVADDGMTLVDPKRRPLAWATSWKDLEAFRELLAARLAGPVR